MMVHDVICVISGIISGRFRGGPSPPPPLGDGLTLSLTVMLANAKF